MRVAGIALIALCILAPTAAADNVGSMFGSMATAHATGRGQTTLSGTIGLTDHTSFLGGINYGFADNLDGRVRVGAVDVDGFDTAVALGGELRWQIWDERETGPGTAGSAAVKHKPFDMSVGPFMEWISLDGNAFGLSQFSETVYQIGGQISGSHTIVFSNGGTLTPYGRLNLRYEHIKIDVPDGTPFGQDVTDSQMALGVNGGVAWGPSQYVVLFGELQIDGNDGLFVGIDFRP